MQLFLRYIVGLIIKTSSSPELMEKERTYLNKLNLILVSILKRQLEYLILFNSSVRTGKDDQFSSVFIFREWPKNWESFIPDIIGASKTNESLCQNNMVILKLLSEEVFDFSSGQMTQTKAKHLKDSMCSQFSEVGSGALTCEKQVHSLEHNSIQVFTLCQFVMDNSNNAALVGLFSILDRINEKLFSI